MRTTLIDAAQTWLQLAEEQEHEGSNIGSPVEERPVVQQQQQTQPKDEDKKE